MTKTSESYGEFSTFPTKLRKLMEERKVTNKKLSEICSVKAQSVSQWAHGETRPDILSLVKIAEFFNVSTDYLLREGDIKTTDLTTKEMCNELGLSETAIGLLKSDVNSAIPQHFAELLESGTDFTPSQTMLTKLTEEHSNFVRYTINQLLNEYVLYHSNYKLNAPFSLSLLELLGRFYECLETKHLEISDSYDYSKTMSTEVITIFHSTKSGKDIAKVIDTKGLLLDSAINEIMAKLVNLKNDCKELIVVDRKEETK